MSSSLKNITIVLVILTCAVVGYYIYVQRDSFTLETADVSMEQDMFATVQEYTARRELLSKVDLKTDIFKDERLKLLVTYSEPVVPVPVGRSNPFDPITQVNTGSNN